MIQKRLGRILRWTAWAIIWGVFHPEFYTKEFQFGSTDEFIRLLLWYFLLGLTLEYIYSKSTAIKPKNVEIDCPSNVAPNCPENPWIPFLRELPPENSLLEFYCIDGKTRTAKTCARINSRLAFEILYEADVLKKQGRDPAKFCPTHWRRNPDEKTEGGIENEF